MNFFQHIAPRSRQLLEFSSFWASILLLGFASSHAQVAKPPAIINLPPALSTSGTGVVVEGNSWGYVVWQASTQDYLNTRDINIYLKSGDATSAAPFALQGTASLLTDPATITPWVNRATKLRTATSGLAEDLGICADNSARLIEQWSPTPNPAIPVPLASRLSLLAVRASQEQGAIDSLRALGGSHPLFRFVSGTGWAGPLNVPIGQDATIELREVNRATGTEGTVVGRVTLRATTMSDMRLSPDLLTAPGSVTQVRPLYLNTLPSPESMIEFLPPSPLPDLTPALRWGIPDAMRPQVLLTRGFMIWRGNANISYLNPTALPANTTRILRNPAAASKIFRPDIIGGTGPWVNDLDGDRTTFFASDDNGRYHFTQTNPVVFTGTAHVANSQHFYHIAAVDLLGRYSPLAPVGNAKAIHTLPPAIPLINRIENTFENSQQKLRLAIQPNLNNTPGVPPTHRYLVFRDRLKNTPPPTLVGNTGLLDKSVDPKRHNELIYVGSINQPADPTREIYFTDEQLIPSAATDFGQTYYYCVRAVNNTDLGMNPSPPSPPVFGTARDRTGPPAPTGFIFTEAPRAALGYSATQINQVADSSLPENVSVLRFRFLRADPGIARIRLTITSNLPGDDPRTGLPVERVLPELVFGNSDSITFDYPFGLLTNSGNIGISIRAVTSQGRAGIALSLSNPSSSFSKRTRFTISLDTRSGTLLQMNPAINSIWQPFFTRGDNSSTLFTFSPVSSAAIFNFDGTTLTPRSTLSGTPHQWLNPIGTDLLLTKASTGWQRFNTSFNNALLNPTGAGANYPAFTPASRVSNVVFLNGEPFVDPTATPVAQASIRAWSTAASGSGTAWSITSAPIDSAGIGTPTVSSYTASNSANYAITNQFRPNISLTNLQPAAGAITSDLTITPAGGTFRPADGNLRPAEKVTLIFNPTVAGDDIKYRLNGGSWLFYDFNTPPVIEATTFVEAYAYSTTPRRSSPTRSATYTFAAAPALSLGATVDADSDGLPDAWEKAFNSTTPNGDTDGDGVSNLAEYLAGNDPRDSLSAPPLPPLTVASSLVSVGNNGFFRLEWSAALGNPILESNTTLTGNWTSVVSGIQLNGQTFSYQTPASGSKAFYRLRRP